MHRIREKEVEPSKERLRKSGLDLRVSHQHCVNLGEKLAPRMREVIQGCRERDIIQWSS